VVTCLGLVAQAPAGAAVHHRHQEPAPVIHYLPRPRLAAPPGQQPRPVVDCTRKCPVYLICLSSAHTHCLGWDSATTAEVVSSIVGAAAAIATLIFQIIVNRKGQSTERDDGVYKGKHEKPPEFRECLGDAPTTIDSNNRAYLTSNCFDNPYTSWEANADHPGEYDYFNVHALQEGRDYQMVQLNLRNGAYIYAKPEVAWSTYSWYRAGTCIKNC
jgi:hypothetical protein